jgi:hypothetical protein
MKTSRTIALVYRSLLSCAAASLAAMPGACTSDGGQGAGGAGGSSGSGAVAGKMGGGGAGTSAGGSGGSGGGGAGSGGAAAGSGGKAGAGASGGSGESGRGGVGGTSGGSAGASGAASAGEAGAAGEDGAGGSSGSAGAAGGSSGSSGSSGSGGNGGSAGSGGGTIDTCFQGLRPLEGTTQISTRENAGEQIRLRLALETADRGGTSGTYAWGPVRLALEIDGTLICLDEAALAGTYTGSRHNCTDVLSFDHDGKTYEIDPPDSRELAAAILTVSSNGSVVRGPLTLDGIECMGSGVSTMCRSGGPC